MKSLGNNRWRSGKRIRKSPPIFTTRHGMVGEQEKKTWRKPQVTGEVLRAVYCSTVLG